MSGAATRTDTNVIEWSMGDEVVRLRQWGTDHIHMLSPPPSDGWLVGTAETCSLKLGDRYVSREHARLIQDRGKWSMRDLGSKNGLRYDGARCKTVLLEPGLEIGIGGMTLIAESRQSMALHGFLGRILGWGADRTAAVDHALRSIRMAMTRRTALMLAGKSDLVPVAYALHRHTLGAHRPFAASDPRRGNTPESVRSAANYVSGQAGFEAAIGGSLCVRGFRLPRDFADVLVRLREHDARVQLIVCTQRRGKGDAFLAVPIEVPPLAERTTELPRIVDEYARDAAAELRVPLASFTRADREWVLKHGVTSLAEIEKATLRLIALRISESLPRAAERLGMAPVSLSRWIGRRKLPLQFES